MSEEDVPGARRRERPPQLDLFGAPASAVAEPAPKASTAAPAPRAVAPDPGEAGKAAVTGEVVETDGAGASVQTGKTRAAAVTGAAEATAAPGVAPLAEDTGIGAPLGARVGSPDTGIGTPVDAGAVEAPGATRRRRTTSPATGRGKTSRRPREGNPGSSPDPAAAAAREEIRALDPAAPAVSPPPEPPPPEPARPPRNEVLTVSGLAARLRGLLEKSYPFVLVRGEISNLRQPGSGHLYFSLKDDGASVRAVLFRGQARLLRFRPENGQEVVARGRVSFYEASGDAQLVCDFLEPVGAGALAVAFDQLKKKLAAEGLFDPARKRPLPFLPRRVGVVTSPSGAAIRDFLRVLHRRFPGISVLVAPARVQGDGAAAEIARGVARLSARDDVDVVVVTRGGGSIEDLWAFNEEPVARAIAACRHPVVSAVGHEVDFTIADFVADLRAPTPTAAAETLAPVEADLRASLAVAWGRLHKAVARSVEVRAAAVHRLRTRLGDPRRRLADGRIGLDERRGRAHAALRRELGSRRAALRESARRLRAAHPVAALKLRRRDLELFDDRLRRAQLAALGARRGRLDELRSRLLRAGPRDRILRDGRRLADLATRLGAAVRRDGDRRRAALADLSARVHSLSPLRVLARGYAVAFRASGAVLLRAADAVPGERLHLEVADGALAVDVVGVVPPRKERE